MADLDMEGLQVSGWQLPGAEHDDGQLAVGQRVFVAGHGIGLVTGFNRATVKHTPQHNLISSQVF